MLAVWVWLALVAAPAAAQRTPAASPSDDYWSPSGSLWLSVTPAASNGVGPAHCAMRRAGTGELVWERDLPLTFQDAAVADDGRVAGHGETRPSRFARYDDPGELVFLALAADGRSLGEQRVARLPPQSPDGPPTPRARGVVIQPEADLAVLLVSDPDIDRDRERWWRIDLASGQQLPTVADPRGALEASGEARWSVAARAVPGTPLILVHWWAEHTDDLSGKRVGSVFSLHAPDGRPVWELSWPGDLEHADRDEERRIADRVLAGAGLAAVGPGTFTLWRARGDERVTFAVRRDGDEWVVTGSEPAPAAPKSGGESPAGREEADRPAEQGG